MLDQAALERALDRLPLEHKGPGGVAGVVKDGKIIATRAWGFADMNRRLAMGQGTRLPICSISKQFTCALLLDQFGDLSALQGDVAALLPGFQGQLPTVKQLADNQSGLRDYWALTVLQGAFAEQEFRREDALPLLARMKTGHFAPGTSYSYCNNNFRILGEIIERRTGRDFGGLLTERILSPAGMQTAALMPDSRVNADGVVGYEGNDEMGFLPAQNGIYWFGDAGMSASLTDMLAWECFIDATRDDAAGLYNRLSQAPRFANGKAAQYGFGLSHSVVAGRQTTGHGGALRGFRAHRRHVAEERLSVVVMFNHEGDAHGAALSLIEAALGAPATVKSAASADWAGLWLDEGRGMILRATPGPRGLRVDYGTNAALLKTAEDTAQGGGLCLTRSPQGMVLTVAGEDHAAPLSPLTPIDHAAAADLGGTYWCDELQASMTLDARDGALYAAFDGMLGQGPMERAYPVAQDVWIITTRRSMDASPPGDWTLLVHRDAKGQVSGLTLGCWLARGLAYTRRA